MKRREREPGFVVAVSAAMRSRVDVIHDKLSARGTLVTGGETLRALALVALSRLEDSTGAAPLELRKLRRMARAEPGPGAKSIRVVLDANATARELAFRVRLSARGRSITRAAAVRTLVWVGLEYAETVAAADLGLALLRFTSAPVPSPREIRAVFTGKGLWDTWRVERSASGEHLCNVVFKIDISGNGLYLVLSPDPGSGLLSEGCFRFDAWNEVEACRLLRDLVAKLYASDAVRIIVPSARPA